MKKLITSILLCAALVAQVVPANAATDQWGQPAFEQMSIDTNMVDPNAQGNTTTPEETAPTSAAFNLSVGMMSETQIKAIGQNFTKIDLTQVANRDIKDEVEGDHAGGWSDQGENDLRQFDLFGNQTMLGVPFTFIDPAKNANKAVLGLRGQNDTGLPLEVTIPVNKKTAGAYFIQASPWCSGTCGVYTWVYEDGSERYMTIDQNEEIADFWGVPSLDYVRPVWVVDKEDGKRSLSLFAMNNPLPDKTVKELKLKGSGGGAYIMIMAITLTDQGPFLPATASADSVTMSTYGWYDYKLRDESKVAGTAIDFSKYLDAPAGKHGALVANGENFAFEDGTAVKFWGADIVGNAAFPTKEEADRAAKRLAHSGINLVRFTRFDDDVLKAGKTSELDSDKMDKFAYFVSKLKENGIYSYISFLAERTLKEDSGIENWADFNKGYGVDAFFDAELIELQKKFVSDFLGYNNSYTGTTLGEDPSIIMGELVYDLSLFDISYGNLRQSAANKAQRAKFDALFTEFVKSKYTSTDLLAAVWTSSYDRREDCTVEDGNLEYTMDKGNIFISKGYKNDAHEFIKSVMNNYYTQMKEAFGSSKMLVTINSNRVDDNTLSDVVGNAKSDFVTRRFYNDKVYGDNDKLSYSTIFHRFGYKAMVQNMADNMVMKFAEAVPSNVPYIANWATAGHNLYTSEAPVMMAAVAGSNNWSAIQYSFASDVYPEKNYIDDNYAIYNNPVRLALSQLGASLFYGTKALETQVADVTAYDAATDKAATDLGNADIFGKNVKFNFDALATKKNKAKENVTVKRNNLYWNTNQGLFAYQNDKAEALTGYVSAREDHTTFALESSNRFATVGLVALDDNNVKSSDHYLLTAVCGVQNFKAAINLEKNIYDNLGDEQIVIEPVTGTFTLKRSGDFVVYALSSSGERMGQVATSKNRQGFTTFEMTSNQKAIQYEIVAK